MLAIRLLRYLAPAHLYFSTVAAQSAQDQLTLQAILALNQAYLFPNNAEQARMINSSLFTPDVVGRLDITSFFVGAELNTEYLFGLFASLGQAANTSISLLPFRSTAPSSRSPIDGAVASFGVIIEYEWSNASLTLPIQADGLVRIDGQGRIQQYDFVLRRFAQAFPLATSALLPALAREEGLPLPPEQPQYPPNIVIFPDRNHHKHPPSPTSTRTSYRYISTTTTGTTSAPSPTRSPPSLTNPLYDYHDPATQRILQAHAARSVCAVHEEFCTGDLQQYESTEECLRVLKEDKVLGDPFELGEDTALCRYVHTLCRYVHKEMLFLRPEVHCAYIGPSGGGQCSPGSYFDVVQTNPFQFNFVGDSWARVELERKGGGEVEMPDAELVAQAAAVAAGSESGARRMGAGMGRFGVGLAVVMVIVCWLG